MDSGEGSDEPANKRKKEAKLEPRQLHVTLLIDKLAEHYRVPSFHFLVSQLNTDQLHLSQGFLDLK